MTRCPKLPVIIGTIATMINGMQLMPILIARDPRSCRRMYVLIALRQIHLDLRHAKNDFGKRIARISGPRQSFDEDIVSGTARSRSILDIKHDARCLREGADLLAWTWGAPTATQVFRTSVKLDERTSGMQCDARGEQSPSIYLHAWLTLRRRLDFPGPRDGRRRTADRVSTARVSYSRQISEQMSI